MTEPVSDAERALIRAEHLSGLPIPDISEPADVETWRSEHQTTEGGEPAVYKAAADLERTAREELELELEP